MADWLLYSIATGQQIGVAPRQAQPTVTPAGFAWRQEDGATPSMLGNDYVDEAIQPPPPPEDLVRMHNAIFALQVQTRDWQFGVDDYGQGLPTIWVSNAHDFLTFNLWAARAIAMDATRPIAKRIAALLLLAQGAADVVNPVVYFDIAHLLTAPTRAQAWVMFDASGDPHRVNLADSVAYGPADLPAGINIFGDWATGITE